MDPEDNITKKIAAFVSRWSSSHRIKFGGVVGKIAYITIACVAGAVAAAWRGGSEMFRGAEFLAIFTFGTFVIHRILKYAETHPEATLEGSEILAWHQQQAMAAKGLPQPPEGSVLIPGPLQVPGSEE